MTDSFDIERVEEELNQELGIIPPSTGNITITVIPKTTPPFAEMIETIEEPPKEELKDLQKNYEHDIHKLLDYIIESSNSWKVKDLDPPHLIVHDVLEYQTLQKFRSVRDLNTNLFTKNLIDKLIVHEDKVFESRNDDKKVRSIVVDPPKEEKKEELKEEKKEEPKSKKKGFFSKKHK